MTHRSSRSVVVIGAGPAGLMAAIAAAEAGARVVVHEQLSEAGVKLLSTGGGRCNFTNTLGTEDFMARFGRHGRFMQPALARMGSSGLRRFLEQLGVPSRSPDGFHVFPVSESAPSVRNALVRRCRELDVEFVFGSDIRSLKTVSVMAPRVIVATGGRSYPQLGGRGTGYALAVQAGHTIVQPVPALVPLVTRESWPAKLAGVSLEEAGVKLDLRGGDRTMARGPVLFTHRGLSGPPVLNVSGAAAAALEQAKAVGLRVDLAPGLTTGQLAAKLGRWRASAGARKAAVLLRDLVPAALARVLVAEAGIGLASTASRMSRRQEDALVRTMKALPLTIRATEGFDHAMVTRGGVSLKEVRPDTLESRLMKGLFFAGEVLDLDGRCGGFNLQWAFSSGWLAGSSAGRSREHTE